MFSFFKKRPPKGNPAPDSSPPETDPERMTLAERKTYRREMLYQSIRDNMKQLQVLSSMYKFKVMNVDERHHRFIAMIEVTSTFEARKDGMSLGFNQIEDYIKKRTFEYFGVGLDTIFWRVNETLESFVRTSRAGDSPNAARQDIPDDVSNAHQRRLSRGQSEPVTAQERQTSDGAVKSGSQLADISVNHLDYQSELAPLQSTEQNGGTQYGQL
jgi:hypothetical protein